LTAEMMAVPPVPAAGALVLRMHSAINTRSVLAPPVVVACGDVANGAVPVS
jgi:hypothetical protein